MNFQSLKIMVSSLIETFECPNCNSKINDKSIEIMGTAGTNINIDITCSKCGEHSMMMAQVLSGNIPAEIKLNKGEVIEKLQEKLSTIGKYKDKIDEIGEILNNTKNNNNLIKDTEIISLNKKLKSINFSMDDLFNNNK